MIRTNTKLAAVAVLATAALAGCGDSDSGSGAGSADAGTQSFGGSTPAASTPAAKAATGSTAAWAKEFCTAMAGKAKAVQPPKIDNSSPTATKQSLVTFFTALGDQLSTQVTTLKTVGSPPGANGRVEYRKSIKKLRAIDGKINDITADLQKTNPSNAKDLQTIISGLGDKMKVIGAYPGAVQGLSGTNALGPALQAEPACAKIS